MVVLEGEAARPILFRHHTLIGGFVKAFRKTPEELILNFRFNQERGRVDEVIQASRILQERRRREASRSDDRARGRNK